MLKEITNYLDKIFDKKDIKTDLVSKNSYGKDWSNNPDPSPCAIVFPRSAEQIVDIINICNEIKHPFIGSGGRTGYSGGACANSNELVISLEKMNSIIDFDDTNNTVFCESGLITKNLQDFAKQNDLFYPIDFSSSGSSQIGGNISTNAGGIKVVKYGLTKNYVKGLRVVSGNGEFLQFDNNLLKDATGPDLKDIFIGSEGIFGIITNCRIQLIEQPKETKVFMLGIKNINTISTIIEEIINLDIEAIEFINRKSIESVKKSFDLSEPLSDKYKYYILIESSNNSLMKVLERLIHRNKIQDVVVADNHKQKTDLWKYRMLVSESIARQKPIKFDLAVPIKNFIDLVHDLEKRYENSDLFTLILFAHIGDGNLHLNFVKNNGFCDEKAINHDDIYDLVISHMGTISAEHGIGSLKREAFLKYAEKIKIDFLRNNKRTFDKNNLLNPGKLI